MYYAPNRNDYLYKACKMKNLFVPQRGFIQECLIRSDFLRFCTYIYLYEYKF